jgi:hypothetical protein
MKSPFYWVELEVHNESCAYDEVNTRARIEYVIANSSTLRHQNFF